ncbi:3-hydroxyacyl-CoA dehydrogenase family protein [Arthrobacter sp. BB-1]|uniref:3-hydroxyacyl-CoA dehydrogenase family protein n=1 Tax=unclassified Arthrobacter TaxID=235627 RepID=UPI0011127AD0|nr:MULTISPECIES: 3-hydroxyacyl-CoA dehydrogenase family protein [unclassified Arthrobacter]TNB69460.1 3-hydroxyacyl-CoA dehydrogenase family protein [Arthrobacter sp. BB-1]
MTIKDTISTAAVVGSGYMGGGIAQVLALHGYKVMLGDVDGETAESARMRLVQQAKGFEAQRLLPEGAAKTIEGNLVAAASIEEAVAAADYIAEAVPEKPDLKAAILRRVSAAAPSHAIIGTNTSAIPISELAASVTGPERFLGVHWMNPAPFIPGVELIPGEDTDPSVLDRAEELIRSLGKTPARVADTPGFVANRLQFALYKEAARIVEEGVATPDQIDAVVSNTFGFRLALFGPFAIGDMAGLDVYESAYRTLEKAYGERFAAPEALAATVREGNIGLKSGHGFLDIDPAQKDALLAYRDNAYARLSQLRAELGHAPGL